MYKNKKTFTLIEVLIVVIIIGLIAAALVPKISHISAKVRNTARFTDIKKIRDVITIYDMDNAGLPSTFNMLTPSYFSLLPRDPKGNSWNNGPTNNMFWNDIIDQPTAGGAMTGISQLSGGYMLFYYKYHPINYILESVGRESILLVSKIESLGSNDSNLGCGGPEECNNYNKTTANYICGVGYGACTSVLNTVPFPNYYIRYGTYIPNEDGGDEEVYITTPNTEPYLHYAWLIRKK